MKRFLKNLAIKTLNFLAGSKLFSKSFHYYLLPIFKAFPDFSLKFTVLGIISQVKWAPIELLSQRVFIGDVPVYLIPNFNEFNYAGVIINHLPYEKELYSWLKEIITKYDTIIDIGANIGVFSVFAAESCKQAQIISFEPSKEAFRRLLNNIHINNLKNIAAYNAAISADLGLAIFFEPKDHLTNGSLLQDFTLIWDKAPASSQVVVLDSTVIDLLLAKSNQVLIKIDVEGFESEVLKNLKNIITDKKPDLIVEVLKEFEDELNDLDFLYEYYDFYLISDTLIKRTCFQGDDLYRDYFLKAKNQNN